MTERAQTLRAVKTVDFMTAKFSHLPFVSHRRRLSESDRHSQAMTGTSWQRQASSIRLYRKRTS
ncbi:MAG: hypothetical protein K1566_06505 [Candidatus Thiodiazotropha sp. (ex. Lucinisca nassula)]|nr:hypothetical protein [Candidatus Thiodiazotropha sp. (ex. Lucinisca nassula)]MBW9269275.1 hypothetical protein [Candidatus Thiodiazotropha sp. (ex. Lucinisca nassula)]